MSDLENLVRGEIVGINMVRHPSPHGLETEVTNFIVRLVDGREVTAVKALPQLKHVAQLRPLHIGSLVKLDLGTAIDPIRIVEIQES